MRQFVGLARMVVEDGGGQGAVREAAMILSVVAGKPIQDFVEATLIQRVVRSIPNTPAQSEFHNINSLSKIHFIPLFSSCDWIWI